MASEPTPVRRALLIGINRYPKFPDRQLHGCVNDVTLMHSMLRDHFGFPAENSTVLLDEQATRANILAGLDKLVANTKADDVVVVFYSGHGSQILDRLRIEPDGMDETIVAYDSSHTMGEPNRDVTDKEIYLRLCALGQKTANITLVFDCCNSGGIPRAVLGGTSRRVPADLREADQLGLPMLTQQEEALVRSASRGTRSTRWFPLNDRYVLLASCLDKEESFEYPPDPGPADTIQGTLTFFLHQELIKAEPGTTYRDVFERVQRLVNTTYPAQHPQMEGTRDRELFGLHDFRPMRFVTVTVRNADQVTLAAGAAHGLTVGSRWAIYPQGIKEVTPQTAPLASICLSAVRGLTSDATITQAANREAVVPGSRAVEVEHDYGDMTLRVGLVVAVPGRPAGVDELEKKIKGSAMLRRAQKGAGVDVQVYLLPARDATPTDPLYQIEKLRKLTEPTWVLIGGGDQLLALPRPAAQPGVTGILLGNLEKIARFRNLLAIKNPNPVNPLKDQIEFTLLQRGPDGKWKPAQGEDGGLPAYRDGERFAFRLHHVYPQPLFIHILDFDLDYGVDLAYPVEGANEEHAQYQTVEYGVPDNREIPLEMPAAFQGSEGVETLKLIAATRAVDFSWMEQEGVKAVGMAKPSSLEELLRRVGSQTRGDTPRVPTTEEWITIERSFLLRRS
jgi:hypothetical protein